MMKSANKTINKKNKNITIFNKNCYIFSFFDISKKNINNLVNKLIYKEIDLKKLINPESLKYNKEIFLEKFNQKNIQISLKNTENFKKSIDIGKFSINNNNVQDRHLRDSLSEHFSLQTKLKLNNFNNNIEKDLEIYSILTTKESYETNIQNEIIKWDVENLTQNNLIPREYRLWWKKNLDNLEQMRAYDFEQFELKIFEKLSEIYENSNNETYLQKISENIIVDLDNSISYNKNREYEDLAIEFYKNEYENILKINCDNKISIFNNVLWSEIEKLPEKFCIKFIENEEVISYIVNIITKGTIFLK